METLSHAPDRVVFGAGAESAVADLLAELGARRVLLVAQAHHADGASRIAAALGARAAGVFTTDRAQVPAEVADAAVARAREVGADWIVAHGGGTPIGVAKAIALSLPVAICAVPTTYAGSERTDIWGITRDGKKTTGRDARVRPRLVVYDPELTLALDRALSIDSLFNALAHSLEALYAHDVTPDARRAAEASLAPLVAGMRAIAKDPADRAGRALALRGAALASESLAHASMGLHHKLAHVLGGLGAPHARTHATLLPYTFGFNAPAVPDLLRLLHRTWGADDPPAFLYDLQRELGLATSLGALGIAADRVAAIVDEALAASYANPRPIDRGALLGLFDDMLHDRRPSLPIDSRLYRSGFGAPHASEARPGALPERQNSPRRVPYGLVAEQLNGTGFTVRRADNRRTWMYRLRPQVLPGAFTPRDHARFVGRFDGGVPLPEHLGFRPLALPTEPTDFVAGLVTFAGAGDPTIGRGAAVHLYAANADMTRTALCNIDGDLVVVPELGRLHVQTELGRLSVSPGELVILPRGIRFRIALPDRAARGFVGELFDGHLALPERGPIGANGMADERHFLAPVADFEDDTAPWTIVVRQGGRLWQVESPHSPFDVVAWHGNYTPYKYDLACFQSLGSVSFDHPDPSILTVLTCPIDVQGRSALDLGVFRGRWDISQHTFRPPFFHRNSASEFNGVVSTPAGGHWQPGAFTFTPYLTPHGVSASAYEQAVTAADDVADRHERIPDDSLWIQLESAYPLLVMPWMLDHPSRDRGHLARFRDFRPPSQLQRRD